MYEKIVLDNGLRIVAERIPYVRTVSVGIWVGAGSRHELASESGAAHFIEHMVFKGTDRRTAQDLAAEMDEIGGQINAFTTKECTCFYGRVLDSHLPQVLDILGDMIFHARFDQGDVENERGVILEEIGMYKDAPEDLVVERLMGAIYKGTALARPILGRPQTLNRMDGAFLKAYMARNYQPGDTVVALAGNLTDGDIERVKALFAPMQPGHLKPYRPAKYTPSFTGKKKATEQNHLCLAFPCHSALDPDRYACQLMSFILGGGLSSRLFQRIREQEGLCYSVYTFSSLFQDTGFHGIYTALGAETETRAIRSILEEIHRIQEEGVTETELRRATEQVKANMLMGLESTSDRMNRLGRNELIHGTVPEIQDVIQAYDQVTTAEIQAMAQKYLDLEALSFSAVGRIRPVEAYRDILGV